MPVTDPYYFMPQPRGRQNFVMPQATPVYGTRDDRGYDTSMPNISPSNFTGGAKGGGTAAGQFGGSLGSAPSAGAVGSGELGASGLSALSTNSGAASGAGAPGLMSSGGALGSFGPVGAIMAAVAATKAREARSSGTENKLWRTFNGPSINQITEDPSSLLSFFVPGSAFLGAGEGSANTKPEWEGLMGK